MDFKLWITLNEARILPHSLVKDIYDYIMDVAKQKAVKPRTAVPSKPFIVDFTGTPYEFLNELPDHEREVAVDGNLTGDDHGVFEPNGRFPSISINVQKQPERLYGTLQHELMHFLQELIQLHHQ